MTPDQLPPGVRVKALEWARAKGISDEIWYSGGYCAGRYSFDDGQWHYSLSDAPLKRTPCKSLNAAKAACQRHHEEQVCAQLEIVNG